MTGQEKRPLSSPSPWALPTLWPSQENRRLLFCGKPSVYSLVPFLLGSLLVRWQHLVPLSLRDQPWFLSFSHPLTQSTPSKMCPCTASPPPLLSITNPVVRASITPARTLQPLPNEAALQPPLLQATVLTTVWAEGPLDHHSGQVWHNLILQDSYGPQSLGGNCRRDCTGSTVSFPWKLWVKGQPQETEQGQVILYRGLWGWSVPRKEATTVLSGHVEASSSLGLRKGKTDQGMTLGSFSKLQARPGHLSEV